MLGGGSDWKVQLDEFLKGVVWVPDDEDEEEGSDEEGEAAAIAAAGSSASSPEQAIAQCLFHLHHLANLWQPVLSPEVRHCRCYTKIRTLNYLRIVTTLILYLPIVQLSKMTRKILSSYDCPSFFSTLFSHLLLKFPKGVPRVPRPALAARHRSAGLGPRGLDSRGGNHHSPPPRHPLGPPPGPCGALWEHASHLGPCHH